ncbi:MAG: hypothetical protein GW762_00590 [Candidatus Pacebacteria bacterium]|nr:hypothetical protein [Candidatus Paceibacterota bacterium]PIR63693.1 MAG: hypothetical protein COU64_03085 [Candidatus Pacebacteria bacterium CG10_big_fil_rev_8_21_14_0_10_40_26]PIZ79696.1 MAG: hypothetical protein COY01_00125 [Candidatus Pacebacteria bacterium CG_4_10_14_0_2_um_filter_40_20]PJA68340.1 MAG: hypothetical protein CO156_05080 [Candidatus Pacebacteria bacterium CG_4_9_14_3_um_filter_40_12]PJC41202.1 MAG: hypothetical protein CO041_05150 [Candidatus Pacebacteria bacterium CG_4_9_
MDLQQALDRFKADLEAYIRDEVARQIAGHVGATQEKNISLAASVSTDLSSTSNSSIQATLDQLSELAIPKEKIVSSESLDELTNYYSDTVSVPTQQDVDYVSDLAGLSQRLQRTDITNNATESLYSLGVTAPTGSATVQPPNVATQNTNEMSGIQSFLNKIRLRKNLSSN